MVNDFPVGLYRESISSYNVGWQGRLDLEYEPDRRFGGFIELENAYWTGTPSYIDGGAQIGLTAGIRARFPLVDVGELGKLELGGDLGYGLLSHVLRGSWTEDEVGSYYGQAILADCEVALDLFSLPFDPFIAARYLFSPGSDGANTQEFGIHVGARYHLKAKPVLSIPLPPPAPKPLLSISFATPAIELFAGETFKAAALKAPADADATKISWSSGDPSVAAVGPDGSIAARKNGETQVFARAEAAGGSAIEAALRVLVWLSPDDILAGAEPRFALGESESRVTSDIGLPKLASDGLPILWGLRRQGHAVARRQGYTAEFRFRRQAGPPQRER